MFDQPWSIVVKVSIGYSIRVGDGKSMKDFTLAALHHLRFRIGFVIVTQKVQKAMHDKVYKVVFERLSLFKSLSLDGFPRDDDVAQHRPRLRSGLDRKCRKRQHIGRLVLATPFGIQGLDRCIIREDDTEFACCAFQSKVGPGGLYGLSDEPFKGVFVLPVAGFDHDIDMDRVI